MKQNFEISIKRNILLNPGPATTSKDVKQALIVPDICPREKEFGDLVKGIREKALTVVNGNKGHECILLGCSGTGAVEACLSSSVDRDDHILIIENGAYGKRMEEICLSLGINFSILRFEWGTPIDLNIVENYLSSHRGKYRVLAFIHHETTTGILNPLRDLHLLAKKYNLVSLVDAMSSYGGVEIDLSEINVEYLVSSSNKCIQGFAGVGIVFIKKNELNSIKDFAKKSFYFDLYQNFKSLEDSGQFRFTPPVQVLYALDAAYDEFFLEGGISQRSQRIRKLGLKMTKGMMDLGFKPLLSDEHSSYILTTFLNPLDASYSFDKMHSYLLEKNITIYPGKMEGNKTFRLSNIGALSEEDIDHFLLEMDNYLVQAGISLK